jgi:hypothetical protein
LTHFLRHARHWHPSRPSARSRRTSDSVRFSQPLGGFRFRFPFCPARPLASKPCGSPRSGGNVDRERGGQHRPLRGGAPVRTDQLRPLLSSSRRTGACRSSGLVSRTARAPAGHYRSA